MYTFTTSCQSDSPMIIHWDVFFVSTGVFFKSYVRRLQIGIEWRLYNLLQKQTPLHTLSLHGSLFWRCDFDNNIWEGSKRNDLVVRQIFAAEKICNLLWVIFFILFWSCVEDLYFRISGNMVSLIPFESCQNLSSVNNIYVKDANSENWNKIPNCILKSHPNFLFGQIKRNLHLLDYQPFELNSLPFE